MVPPNDDVARDQIRNGGIGAAKEDVDARGFEEIVLDRVRAGAVPSRDRLRLLAERFDVGDVAVADGGRAAVERDASLLPLRRIAAHEDAIEHEIARTASSASF